MLHPILLSLLLVCIVYPIQAPSIQKKPHLLIVLGSARDHSTSKKIAQYLQDLTADRVTSEIIDLKDLPLIDPENTIKNGALDRLKNTFNNASAIIVLVPNYNGGYTGVLKNGIDALGNSLTNKPVGLIGYAGGYDGGKEPIQALMPILKTLNVATLDTPVFIPMADSAFDDTGALKKAETKNAFSALLETIFTLINA